MDPRDELWNQSFVTYYESYLQELLGDKIVSRWRTIDDVTKILVALTATGSVVSAWALWETADGKLVWSIIAGIASILSILHASLSVPAKLKDWVEVKQLFTGLRLDLETFRQNMAMNPNFDIDAFNKSYNDLRARYRDAMIRIQNDWFRTRRLAMRIQTEELNPRIEKSSNP